MKKIILLGATGSIGIQSLEVISENSEYSLEAISIGYHVEKLHDIIKEFPSLKAVALLEEKSAKLIKEMYPHLLVYAEDTGIIKMLEETSYDLAINAIIGYAGLQPSISIIKRSKILALANKETMVIAGEIINDLLKQYPQAQLLPVDSEHCALHQCLKGEEIKEVNRLILSASGGSFRDYALDQLKEVTLEQALNHPNWQMGSAITIDSATMFNKGLEVIEAHYLFNIPYEKIDVVIHYESIIHSMIEYVDGSIMAQLSIPDMKHPISYALSYPKRLKHNQYLDFNTLSKLSFKPVDYTRFKALEIAYQAGIKGHSFPCVLNASKEVATNAFINGEIDFLDIIDIVERQIKEHQIIKHPNIEALVNIDYDTRLKTRSLIEKEYIYGSN